MKQNNYNCIYKKSIHYSLNLIYNIHSTFIKYSFISCGYNDSTSRTKWI